MINAILDFMEDGLNIQYLLDEWKMSEDVTEGYIKVEGTKQTGFADIYQTISFSGVRKISIIDLMNIGLKNVPITLTLITDNLFELRSGELLFFEGFPIDVNTKANYRRLN